jgi:hypothetical protein
VIAVSAYFSEYFFEIRSRPELKRAGINPLLLQTSVLG